MRVIASAACVVVALGGAAVVAAETFRFEGGLVEIPAGFTGPVEQRRGNEAVLYGFSKPHPGRTTGTLMQISVFQPPEGTLPVPKDEEVRAAEKYLLAFLGGVERRRTEFSRGAVDTIVVGGTVVARVAWRGRAEGQPMKGVMYCYLLGPRIVTFHTQDFDFAPPDGLAAAVRAFETASLGDGTR